MCASVRETEKERERERQRQRQTDREFHAPWQVPISRVIDERYNLYDSDAARVTVAAK